MRFITDSQLGVFTGLAAGDRIGGPLAMALPLAECLADRGEFEPETVGQRYFEWWQREGFDTGPTAARVFALVEKGASFQEAALKVHTDTGGMTSGCNPVHRAAPLAMFFRLDGAALSDAAVADARLTHLHPLAGDVSAAFVRLCRSAINGRDWPDSLQDASVGRLPETRRALNPKIQGPRHPSGFAPDVLAAAVRFVDRANDFETALGRALFRDSGANYVPVLVGSIAGARWGHRAIPEKFLEMHAEKIPRIQRAANLLTR